MAVKNTIQEFLKQRGLSVYKFQKDTGLAQRTAYDLHNDPDRVPSADVMEKICRAYKVQPGDFLVWEGDRAE
jgi:DNA-binding Xre family transcriptional regulator